MEHLDFQSNIEAMHENRRATQVVARTPPMTDRFHIHAKALWALRRANILKSPFLKQSVKKIILQSSETPNWHLTAHYRSPAAAAIIEAAIQCGIINSESSYQKFCTSSKNKIRHEHMIPTEVIYNLIVHHENPTLEAFEEILRRCGFRATILKDEDKRLHASSVPDLVAFTTADGPGYFDHLCRYKQPKDGEGPIDLVERPATGWLGELSRTSYKRRLPVAWTPVK